MNNKNEIILLEDYLREQMTWSAKTFGNTRRTKGILKHIESEIKEVEDCPEDLSEWIDIIILALDGYWRHGGEYYDIMKHLKRKQEKNFMRQYEKVKDENPSFHIK